LSPVGAAQIISRLTLADVAVADEGLRPSTRRGQPMQQELNARRKTKNTKAVWSEATRIGNPKKFRAARATARFSSWREEKRREKKIY
jgi:hypothetical protein